MKTQPMNTTSMIPSSMTRFVDATSNAIAAVKFAPFRKIDRASAAAAYEQDDEAAPSAAALPSDVAEASGRSLPSSFFDTTACTTADSVKPSTRAQSICQPIPEKAHDVGTYLEGLGVGALEGRQRRRHQRTSMSTRRSFWKPSSVAPIASSSPRDVSLSCEAWTPRLPR